jgi:hypothetical protein
LPLVGGLVLYSTRVESDVVCSLDVAFTSLSAQPAAFAAGATSNTFCSGTLPPPGHTSAAWALRDVKATSREHTTSLSTRVEYSTNPPTSGKHYEIPAQDGIYGQAPQDEQLVHAQEHGRVIIWAKPSLPEHQRAALRALVEEDSYQMFLVPRANMPYPLAVTAWDADPAPNGTGKMMTCTRIGDQTYDAIRAFRDEHRSQGPEPVP